MDVDLTVAMISATVQIDQPQENGQRIVGTGFLVQTTKPDGSPRTVLVTAAHVFNNMPGQAARVGYRFQNPDGSWRYSAQSLAIRQGATQLWVKHPARDVAAMEVQAPPEFARAAVPLSWLAEEKDLKTAELGPGDEVVTLGFPQGYAANIQGFPILRAGRIASYPLTPVSDYPTFLLDIRAVNGNSGGPVFLTDDLHRRPGVPAEARGHFVAGMLTQYMTVNGERMDMGFVTHSAFLRQTIALLDQAEWIGEAARNAAAAAGQPAPVAPATPAGTSAPRR